MLPRLLLATLTVAGAPLAVEGAAVEGGVVEGFALLLLQAATASAAITPTAVVRKRCDLLRVRFVFDGAIGILHVVVVVG
jgi:hypothetical protein